MKEPGADDIASAIAELRLVDDVRYGARPETEAAENVHQILRRNDNLIGVARPSYRFGGLLEMMARPPVMVVKNEPGAAGTRQEMKRPAG
jgi:hypothetical protein